MATKPKCNTPVSKPMIRCPKVIDLPFVAERGALNGRDFWHNVQSTGDMIGDQELGMQLAYFTLQVIKTDDFAPLLGWVVLGMIEKQPPLISLWVFSRQSPMCASVTIKFPLRTWPSKCPPQCNGLTQTDDEAAS